MTAKKTKLAHPGKILREEFMEPVGLSAHALAKVLGVPLPRVNDIVREKRAISAGIPFRRRIITSSIWRRIRMGIAG